MFLVGITGGIASGKSTVAQIFVDSGFPVIDADVMARKVVEPGRKAWHKLKKAFGDEIFHEDGTLNREKLGEIIFDNSEKRKILNEITHPEIMKAMVNEAIKIGFKGYPFVVLAIPLLFESGELVDFMHKIIVVNCEEEEQIRRLVARNKLTEEQAKKRISCQMTLESKCEMADLVVENSGSFEETREQVEKIIKYLKTLKFHYKIRIYILLFISFIAYVILYFTVLK
ncbi:UNVERIFIED_CONTAM: hypothetical protein PYX00_004822 [Menopon gallinae]|uniref:Dephospho-CoA kinase domain-containing protein n=1 Tax=Menopon gallinae TaxID=328185 RepID=A0AAW2I7Z3_9NEOP